MADLTKYRVDYETADGSRRSRLVEAIDAIDAKHVAEFEEGEIIAHATARKVRR